MENQSKYDPSRKTVGAIYRDAQLNNKEQYVIAGDLTNELMSSLVCDLNDTIISDPHQGRPFYITVHEQKDLAMPKMIRRRLLTSVYRPYPEDDTVVFFVNPKNNDVRFCWCLPHWAEMKNILDNETLFDTKMVSLLRSWKNIDLHPFGFRKDPEGNWEANPFWEDERMEQKGIQILTA